MTKKYSGKMLIGSLLSYYKKYGKIPSKRGIDMDKKYPSSTVYIVRYKKWTTALKIAGFKNKDIYTKSRGTQYLIPQGRLKSVSSIYQKERPDYNARFIGA